MTPKNDLIAVDFFCGAGGVTRGLRDAGIKVLKGIDIDITAKKTYEYNNPGSKFVHADIRKISSKEVLSGINRKGKKLVFVGCAPCQPFSKINKAGIHIRSGKMDSRRSLIGSFTRIVEKIIPEYIFIENVPKFADPANRHFGNLIETLSRLGYHFDRKYVNAKEYGVPQNRRRFVLLASIDSEIKIPDGDFGQKGRPYQTVWDVISGYPRIKAGQAHSLIPNHVARKISKPNLERIRNVPKNGGSRLSWPKKLALRCHEDISGYTDTYGRMKWSEPAPTLTSKCTSLSNGRFGHPVQNRAISVREAAALQTFPNDYVFYSNLSDATRHVGNAVPVLLAKRIGEYFQTGLSK